MKNLRLVLAAIAVVAALVGAPSVAAAATAPHVATAHASSSKLVTPDGVPQGCPYGSMCIYRDGGGGGLCIATPNNEPNLGGCTDVDGAVFNNGAPAYADVVAMNYQPGYHGAWTCISQGSYWLYTSAYLFNGGPNTAGYLTNVQNNVASFHWQHNNCGNLRA